ncbi:hypothetical protein LJC68_08485 [Bacteroidales bacterium OttesenSCG-928-B11]|nr:hypothetical protein [Bacteroidales bacterium OttesenSCG-928-C03]MDL2312896.1 hypothetical protein [Bacteroidales bacterium OttesenSCG-928-B11]MDL2326380.1 hypothetical protein [Bacteroidales bacterium OttesenSCG-928-A14]
MNLKTYIPTGMVILFFYGNISACSCIGEKASIKNAFKRNEVVFIGKVINIEMVEILMELVPGAPKYTIPTYRHKVTFIIEKTYKGRIDTNYIEVITGVGGGDCGYLFEVDKSYAVYAERRSKYYNGDTRMDIHLYTDMCKRTTDDTISEKKEIEKYWTPGMAKDTGYIREVFR